MRMTGVTKYNKYDIKIIILFTINYVYYIPHWTTGIVAKHVKIIKYDC